ncbi:4'-phosphopantetheinyl transferase family protein [Chryseobacterium sp. SIMBA_038]|uniref:4'-phosphopantetheinyl transferase family protein n=1 Tax=Chryseobacterium sp. SIMBA_038 TaxID=3085780 RepID=UPI00397E83AF
MVILYTFIDEFKHEFLLDTYLKSFPENFKAKILNYRKWQDAQLSLLGRVLLKYGLNNYYQINEIEIDLTPNNKPFLKGQDIYFNISHSEKLAVCIIAGFPVGIDVEFLNEKINYMDFQSQMTGKEFDEIHHADNKIKCLLKYWTIKEAIIKADGRGLQIDLQSFEFINNECLIDDKMFYVKEISIHENYVGHIAYNKIDTMDKTIFFEEFFY